ncbi:hypothetical protein RB195_013105 [Necator americanus]|uniref:Uncharacterized protein n=1 Tax=Necator americanus TaxID=51031 RepID=A0ABR1DV78_NECAM
MPISGGPQRTTRLEGRVSDVEGGPRETRRVYRFRGRVAPPSPHRRRLHFGAVITITIILPSPSARPPPPLHSSFFDVGLTAHCYHRSSTPRTTCDVPVYRRRHANATRSSGVEVGPRSFSSDDVCSAMRSLGNVCLSRWVNVEALK